ncbi:MAG: sulfatase [Deltaproteobacteria bacterium]|nr:sulfatase [Deltaproteobacteria bacterium]
MNGTAKRLSIVLIVLIAVSAGSYLLLADRRPEIVPSVKDCSDCNVVVILIDTLRADHLPFYGYKLDTAPFLSELASKSAVFERAFSASSWTAPAVASMFTSMLPSDHGVITGFMAIMSHRKAKANPSIKLNRIPAGEITLGEYMRAAGYQTIGVADNLNIGDEMGFSRGFEQFTMYRYKGAETINRTVNESLKKISAEKPYFLYLHYMDPHEPYHRRKPWYTECVEKTGKSGKEKTICAYDSEIRYLDQHIATLFEEHRWLENSIVIMLSDHGEEFWDHGKTGHGKTLYTEMVHVPLMLYHPKWPAKRIAQNVHIMDVLPTLAELHGHPISPKWQGESLLPTLNGLSRHEVRPIVSERLRSTNSRQNWWKRSVVLGDWHFIRTENPERIISNELFDLLNDFRETFNKFTEELARAEKLSELLPTGSGMPENASDSVEVETDQKLLDDLKTLGYLD